SRPTSHVVSSVNVWSLVGVNSYWYKVRLNVSRDLGHRIRVVVKSMAPVAPDRAYVKQNGLMFGVRSAKGFVCPVKPIYFGVSILRHRVSATCEASVKFCSEVASCNLQEFCHKDQACTLALPEIVHGNSRLAQLCLCILSSRSR